MKKNRKFAARNKNLKNKQHPQIRNYAPNMIQKRK